MNLFHEIFLGEEKIFSRKVIFLHAALILMSTLFVMIFSYSTSPLYSLLGGDSAIFQVIGKYWYEGYLPYVNVFDHKGPLIFFVNMLGHAIHPRTGVTVLQIISLYLSCLLAWRAMELYSSNALHKIFFLMVMLIFYASHYEEGNHVEEYSVLFLSAATYCFLRTLKENTFPPLYGFIYGLSFGACFLIRLSDAAQLCCQIFLLALFLIQTHDFKTLQKNFLNFCAGFAVIVLPFVIYFAAHGILYEMLYGTILFNLKYTGATFHQSFIFQVIYDVFHFLPLVIMTIVAVIVLKKNPTRLLRSAIFIGTMMTIMLIGLRPYLHYALIIFPVMPILFAVLHENSNTLQKIWHSPRFSIERFLVKVLVVFTAIQVCTSTFYLKDLCLNEKSAASLMFLVAHNKKAELLNSSEQRNVLRLQKIIPENERKSFVCWGTVNTTSQWIFQTDMKPRERFFMNNTRHFKIDPRIRNEWFDNVRKNYPLWILYGTAPDRKPGEPPKTLSEDAELETLLAEKYSFKGEVYIFPQMMKLYRLKD